MRALIKSILLSVSLLLLMPRRTAQACGFYVFPGEYRFWLMQPDLTNEGDLTPFFFASTYFYGNTITSAKEPYPQQNIDEWYAAVKGKATRPDIDSILNATSPQYFFDEPQKLARSNSFMRYLLQPESRDLYQYLRLSKKVEQVAINNDPWDEQGPASASINNVIKEVRAAYSATQDSFVRLRTAFQLIRLYSYTGQAKELNTVYNNWVEPVDSKSWVKTAALYQKAINAEGAQKSYLLSLAFDRGGYNRAYCLSKFDSQIFSDIIKLARNRHGQNVLLAMKAFNYSGRSLESIRQIYASEPDYKELPFLLLREINKVEDWLVTMRVTEFGTSATAENSYEERPGTDVEANYRSDQLYAKNLYKFLDYISTKQKANSGLLHLYTSHLALLNKDMAAAQQHLSAAGRDAHLPLNMRTQLRINQFLLHLENGFSPAVEKEFMGIINTPTKKLGLYDGDIMKNQLILYTARKLIRNGDRVHGLMMLAHTNRALGDLPLGAYKNVFHEIAELATNTDYSGMIGILDKKDKSPFEKFLSFKNASIPQDLYDWYVRDASNAFNRDHLLDLEASWYISQHRLEEAYATLKQIPDSLWNKGGYGEFIGGNPFYRDFTSPYTDEAAAKHWFNKKQVVAEMIRLEQLARSDPKKAGMCYYQLANAWYNLSYYGTDWQIVKQWWSVNDLNNYDRAINTSEFNDDYFGCKQARKYYDRAVLATKDKKLAILCFYLSQDCLENWKSYLETCKAGNHIADIQPDYMVLRRKGIREIRDYDIVQECETYMSFVKQYNKKF